MTAANIGTISPGFGTLAVGDVIRVDGGMRADIYKKNPDGTYQSLAGLLHATDQAAGRHLLRARLARQRRRVFDAGCATASRTLRSLIDAMDNTMSFQYDPQGKLTTVIDTLGRPISYSYVGNAAGHGAGLCRTVDSLQV